MGEQGTARLASPARLVALGVWLAVSLHGAASRAQEPGGFEVSNFEAGIRLSAGFRDEKSGAFPTERDVLERRFREELLLDLDGYVYHPRLLEYSLVADIGLEQLDTQENSSPDRDFDSNKLSFDFDMLLLKEQPYSGRLYARRADVNTRQAFFPTTRAVTMEVGGEAFAQEWWIPSRLHYHWYNYQAESLTLDEQTRNNLLMDGIRRDGFARYQYRVEYNDVDQTANLFDWEDVRALASVATPLAADGSLMWTNSVYYRDQWGDLDTLYGDARSDLRKRWSESLSSDARIQFLRSEVGDAGPTDTLRGRLALNHRLFESLDSEIGVESFNQDFPGGTLDRYDAIAKFNYRKKTSFGELQASYALDYYVQDQQSTMGVINVVDERHVNVLGVPIVLDNAAVLPGSIVVTDLGGLTVYVEGADYLVTIDGGVATLLIPIASRIAPNQEIFVDYSYVPNPDLKFDNLRQDVLVGLRFEDFASLDLGWGSQNQSVLSGVDINDVIIDSRVLSAAAAVFWGGSQLAGNYLDQDGFTPLTRYGFTASTGLEVTGDLLWHVQAGAFKSRFKDTGGIERGANLGTDFNLRIAETANFVLRAEYRKSNLVTDQGHGFLIDGIFTYRYRKTEIGVELSYSDEVWEVATNRRIGSALVTLTRRF